MAFFITKIHFTLSLFFFRFVEDSNSLSRKESEKLTESGSSAEESDGDSDGEDNRKVVSLLFSVNFASSIFWKLHFSKIIEIKFILKDSKNIHLFVLK